MNDNIKRLSLVAAALPVVAGSPAQDTSPNKSEEGEKYNVIFIAVDDLNDWVGFLGGHPQTLTPNMDRLAGEGMVFERAYCPASISNASRASLMTGYRPSTTGIYGNESFMRDSRVLSDALTLPQWLSKNGYISMARGKIFHTPNGPWSDPQSWDIQSHTGGGYGRPVKEPGKMVNGIPLGEMDANFDWGPTDALFEETTDYLNARWAADQLSKDYDRPFFLACGIFRPHLGWFVPKEFFDKFREEDMILPLVNENDYDDIPGSALKPSKDYFTVRKYGKEKEVIQAYLACINYADACVGVVLDALARSKYADNTIVILWGDHGWHLGEKLRYKKFTLWEEACRMPLIMKVPGMTSPGSRCEAAVNLIDLYPTIAELCRVPSNPANEGRSITKLLNDPERNWNYPAITTMGENRHSVRTERWRYIRYEDGAEELYDHSADSLEWNNLAGDHGYDRIKKRLSKHLPAINVPRVTGSRISEEAGVY